MPKKDPDVLPPTHSEDGDTGVEEESRQAPDSALAQINASEYIAMCNLARKYPRSLERFDDQVMKYANHSEPVALSMFYSLPRANKRIIGPSVRFAEILVPCWQNCAAGARDMDTYESKVSSQGIFFDFENRIKIAIEVDRRIIDKDGRRFNLDMIQTTSAAATSIAYRNSIFRGIPRALWLPAYDQAQLTAVGKAKSFSQSVDLVMDKLVKKGITEWQILNAIGAPSIKDIDREQLVTLATLDREITQSDKTIEELFGSEYDKEIERMFELLKYNETQRRMTRDNYKGRAKELFDFLQSKIPAEHRGTPTPIDKGKGKKAATDKEEKTPAPPAEPKPEPEPKKEEPKPEPEERRPEVIEPHDQGEPKKEEAQTTAPKPQRNFKF